MYRKYSPVINYKIKKYISFSKKIGLEDSDLYQEGLIGLSEAIKSFSEFKNVKFSTFANLCIERQLFSALKKASRKKHDILNSSVPIENEEDEISLIDIIKDNSNNPELYIENKDGYEKLYEDIINILTENEQNVFKLRLNNFSYDEMSRLLNKSYKSIDATLQRIKNKINILLEKN